jgi:hypothetical protein
MNVGRQVILDWPTLASSAGIEQLAGEEEETGTGGAIDNALVD